jgi:hypothetical protein
MSNSLIEGFKERIEKSSSFSSIGIVLPSNNYNNLTNALFELIKDKKDHPWIYVTITKPFHILKNEYKDIINDSNIYFIDCVSRAAGIQAIDPCCFFLDSPSQLEKLILEIVSYVKQNKNQGEPYIVLDSLSSLILYNDDLLVTEFFTHLNNNLILENAHSISLCLEEEMNSAMNKMLYLKNEKIIKVKESFI